MASTAGGEIRRHDAHTDRRFNRGVFSARPSFSRPPTCVANSGELDETTLQHILGG